MMAAYDTALAQFVAGESVVPDPSLPQGIQMVLQGLTNPLNLPFARELWMADAAALLKQVTVPVLITIGKKRSLSSDYDELNLLENISMTNRLC